jgi:hypothetical protein
MRGAFDFACRGVLRGDLGDHERAGVPPRIAGGLAARRLTPAAVTVVEGALTAGHEGQREEGGDEHCTHSPLGEKHELSSFRRPVATHTYLLVNLVPRRGERCREGHSVLALPGLGPEVLSRTYRGGAEENCG